MRIFTLNLNFYVDKHGPWNQRKTLIVEALKRKRPDIIGFQAVAAHPDLYGGSDQALQIAEELGGFQSHYFQDAQKQPDGLMQGSAIISRLPLIEKSHRKLTLKPATGDDNHRVLQRAVFPLAEGKLVFFNAHFSWVEEQAIANVSEAMQFMSDGEKSPALLAGDLNNPPDNSVFIPFKEAGFKDAWTTMHRDQAGYTFESDKPSARIDYFWLSPALAHRMKSVELIPSPPDADARLSDHLGLMVELNMA